MPALAPMRVVGPPPVAPLYGLVNTPGTIIEQSDPHWRGGVLVDSYPTDLPLAHDPCSAGTLRQKAKGEDPPQPEFSSFTVYLPVTCSGLGVGDTAGVELLRSRAREVFIARESYLVERELAFARADTTRPHLTGLDVTEYLNGGAATGPVEALSLLERSIGGTAQQGFVHVDPATFVAMDAHGLLEAVGATMRTRRGNTVIIGDGYIGAEPDSDPVTTDDQNWAFATGPVRLSRDEVEVPRLQDVFDHETNELTVRPERNYVAYWDTHLLRGVLVDRSLTP
jgi:hypothetical protein